MCSVQNNEHSISERARKITFFLLHSSEMDQIEKKSEFASSNKIFSLLGSHTKFAAQTMTVIF